MKLIDSNVFMYAAGSPHPNKEPSVAFIRAVAASPDDVCIDAEVLQEILHRYRSIDRADDGGRVYDLVRKLVPTVVDISARLVDEARALLVVHPELSARDALHAAVVLRDGLEGIVSFDRDFDTVAGIRRLEPGRDL